MHHHILIGILTALAGLTIFWLGFIEIIDIRLGLPSLIAWIMTGSIIACTPDSKPLIIWHLVGSFIILYLGVHFAFQVWDIVTDVIYKHCHPERDGPEWD